MLVTDYSTIEQISARLIESSEELARMVESVAKARQIRDYDGDRRKRALSVAVADILRNGDMSGIAAEHMARSSDGYGEAMKMIGKDLVNAEQIITAWDAAKLRWETARSLLSVQKTMSQETCSHDQRRPTQPSRQNRDEPGP